MSDRSLRMSITSRLTSLLFFVLVLPDHTRSDQSVGVSCEIQLNFANGTRSNTSGVCMSNRDCYLPSFRSFDTTRRPNLTGNCANNANFDQSTIVCCPILLIQSDSRNTSNFRFDDELRKQTNLSSGIFDSHSSSPTFFSMPVPTPIPARFPAATSPPEAFARSPANVNTSRDTKDIWTRYPALDLAPVSIDRSKVSPAFNESVLFANCGQSTPPISINTSKSVYSFFGQVWLDDNPLCVAVLISDRHLLTTGQCRPLLSLSSHQLQQRATIRLPAASSDSGRPIIRAVESPTSSVHPAKSWMSFDSQTLILVELKKPINLSNQIGVICVARNPLKGEPLIQIELDKEAESKSTRPVRRMVKNLCLDAFKTQFKSCSDTFGGKRIHPASGPTRPTTRRTFSMSASKQSHRYPAQRLPPSRLNSNYRPNHWTPQAIKGGMTRISNVAPAWTIYNHNRFEPTADSHSSPSPLPSAPSFVSRYQFSIPDHPIAFWNRFRRSISSKPASKLNQGHLNACSPVARRRVLQQIERDTSAVCVSGNITDTFGCRNNANSLLVSELTLPDPDLSFATDTDETDDEFERPDLIPVSFSSSSAATKRLFLVGQIVSNSWCDGQTNPNSVTSLAHAIDSHLDWIFGQVRFN